MDDKRVLKSENDSLQLQAEGRFHTTVTEGEGHD